MINQLVLVGRLTKDPELRYTNEGIPFSHVTLAVSRHYRNSDGEVEADFVNVTLWKKQAENTVSYCKKGALIGVTGKVQSRSFENQQQQRVYVTDIVADYVKFLSSKREM
ncbi:single-stranded DNA-binding protein [Bacillus sp. CGMCC 1.16541]|uniref:single-stranded DNA-binding protein n=1 Tax=Bacillus sp. CGMCC 1.16541 TaxID=2185143 RepID=UPI000D73A413|nr:single-stranded DNA-binding protein [Bacillus sp. CGMCC 1.16541]